MVDKVFSNIEPTVKKSEIEHADEDPRISRLLRKLKQTVSPTFLCPLKSSFALFLLLLFQLGLFFPQLGLG